MLTIRVVKLMEFFGFFFFRLEFSEFWFCFEIEKCILKKSSNISIFCPNTKFLYPNLSKKNQLQIFKPKPITQIQTHSRKKKKTIARTFKPSCSLSLDPQSIKTRQRRRHLRRHPIQQHPKRHHQTQVVHPQTTINPLPQIGVSIGQADRV